MHPIASKLFKHLAPILKDLLSFFLAIVGVLSLLIISVISMASGETIYCKSCPGHYYPGILRPMLIIWAFTVPLSLVALYFTSTYQTRWSQTSRLTIVAAIFAAITLIFVFSYTMRTEPRNWRVHNENTLKFEPDPDEESQIRF